MSEIERALDRVAAALDWLDSPPVFVGGATIGLFLDDFGRAQMRPTEDVDCILPDVLSYPAWSEIEENLRRRGWSPVPDGPLCRYRTPSGDLVDLMTQEPEVLGFSGRWYPGAVASAVERDLVTGRRVLVPAPEYALACKLDAWNDRGRADPLASEDLEDVVALLDGCEALPGAIDAAEPELREWLVEQLDELGRVERFRDAMLAQLPRGGDRAAREANLVEVLKRFSARE